MRERVTLRSTEVDCSEHDLEECSHFLKSTLEMLGPAFVFGGRILLLGVEAVFEVGREVVLVEV
jgi:hypothetical protein